MKSALAVLLLALVPLSSLRMVCVTSHDLVGRMDTASTPSAGEAGTAECDRICKRHPAAAKQVPPSSPTVKCLLVADPMCEYLTAAAAAVLPAAPALPREEHRTPVEPFVRSAYVSPLPSQLTPPPKADA